MSTPYDHDHENEITLFAETNFRNQQRRFGIKTDDRRRHMYILGKTGMGKTTLLENMILSDIYAGHGCCYVDPHGDTAEKLTDFIPSHRINDVIYFNPADVAYPMGFNILETDNEDQKPLVASGLMGVFKKIWPDVWSPRMEYILMNCVLALLDYPGATLLGISRLLVDKEYRERVVAKIRDPIVKTFWVAEFTSWSEKYATEAIAPVQNKVGQFLSSTVIRNIVAQVKSTINFRQAMDDRKIIIVNLSKGRIGEDNMRLLGGMCVTKIQLAAQERQNMDEASRRDFYLYVDEFQNFANESFATILSEARKYRLNLIVAHQYIEQLDEKVAPAIIGNVGTIILMRIGGTDAEFFETEFAPTFLPEDMVNLAKYQVYLKLMVDGVATPPFSANTLSPIAKRTESHQKIVQVSRERYAEPRAVIEEKVLKWSGFELATRSTETPQPITTPEGNVVQYEQVVPAPSSPEVPVSAAISYPRIETDEERELREVTEQPPGTLRPATMTSPEVFGPESHPTDESHEYLLMKPERLAAIAVASPGKKKDRPRFQHVCSRCGKTWELAIQLDPTRPMYCPECRPIVLEERKNKGSERKQIARTPPPPEKSAAGSPPSLPPSVNRPRVVRDPGEPASPPVESSADEPPRLSLFDEVVETTGPRDRIETDKRVLEERAGSVTTDHSRHRDRDRDRDRDRPPRDRDRSRSRDRDRSSGADRTAGQDAGGGRNRDRSRDQGRDQDRSGGRDRGRDRRDRREDRRPPRTDVPPSSTPSSPPSPIDLGNHSPSEPSSPGTSSAPTPNAHGKTLAPGQRITF